MTKMLVFSVFFQTLFLFIATREIPSFVHLCKRRDPELVKCFTNSVYEIIPYLAKGIPELNFPALEPVHIERISVNSGNAKELSLEAELSNIIIIGITNVDMRDFTIDLDKPGFTTVLYFPNLQIKAQYKVKGKFMLLELNSAGQVEANVTGVLVDGIYSASFYIKDGKEHISIDKLTPTMNISSVSIHFDNLFSNNQELTETVNKAINENIDSLVDSLMPVIEETVGKVALRYHQIVYELYPVSQLYPDD